MEQPTEEPVTEAAAETTPEVAPEAAAETPIEAAQQPNAEAAQAPVAEAAEAAQPPAAVAPQAPSAKAAKPAVKARSSNSFNSHLGALLTQLYADYDFQQVEDCPAGSRIVDLWALTAELKASAPTAPQEGSAKSKNPWPPRTDLAQRPQDYRLHVHLSTTKDPAWSVPGKDIFAINKDGASGLLLLMADQRGYFLPSSRLKDLCEIFSPVQTSPFKITGPKLRKAAIARFFSLAGLARELAEARRK